MTWRILNTWMLAAAAAVLLAGVPSSVSAQDAERVTEVGVAGNANINTETIQNVISLKPGDDYTEAAVDKDKAAIMSLGYFSVVTAHKEQVPGGLNVVYEVTENPKVASVQVVGSDPIPAGQIIALMKTKSGRVLNTTTLNQDIEAIESYYRDEKYIAYVTEDIGVDPQTGVLTVPILVHRVESVEITGNKKTKSYVFLREMKTRPGSIFNVGILRDDIIKIYNLDILEEVKPYQISPGSEVGLVKTAIPVVEKKTGQVSVGFGYSSKQKLVGQARLSETNFRGKGQGLNLLFEQGTSEGVGGNASYELGFFEPWIDKRHTSLSASYFNKILYRFASGVFGPQDLVGDQTYNERHQGGDLTVSRPLTEKTRVYIGGRFENVETNPDLITGDVFRIVQDGNVVIGSLRAIHNTRDFDLDPAAGGYEGFTFEFGSVDGNRYREVAINDFEPVPFKGAYSKGMIDLRRYMSPGGRKSNPQDKRNTIAMRLRVGMASGTVPFFEQFFVGGSESLRGYREDRFWGTKMLLASVEYRKPIAQAITGVLFVDYGDAWDAPLEYFITQLPQTEAFRGFFGTGVGIRVTTPIGHIRLDYGVGTEGGRTHFSMGQAF